MSSSDPGGHNNAGTTTTPAPTLTARLETVANDALSALADTLQALTEPTGPTDLRLDDDDVYEALSCERRRRAITHVANEGHTTIGDASEVIAAIENDKPRSQIQGQERKRVYIGLHQCHLPKLDEAGIVIYDDNRGTVYATEEAHQLRDAMAVIADARGDHA